MNSYFLVRVVCSDCGDTFLDKERVSKCIDCEVLAVSKYLEEDDEPLDYSDLLTEWDAQDAEDERKLEALCKYGEYEDGVEDLL